MQERAEWRGKTAHMARKNPAAVELGRKGGKATARNMTVEERIEKMRRAAQARWAKTEKLVAEITEGTKVLLKKTQKAAKQRKKPQP
jgi:hypothetical protein